MYKTVLYPLGLKAFVLCVAYKADDALKRNSSQHFHGTSTALKPLEHLAGENLWSNKWARKTDRDGRDEEIIRAWEEEKASLEVEIMKKEKEMKEVRSKKL